MSGGVSKTVLTGRPAGAPSPYKGQERFVEGDFKVLAWSEALAVQVTTGAYGPAADKTVQAAQFKQAREAGLLPDEAVAALKKAGYTDLR